MTQETRRSPYKGLIPYSEEDAPFFFGRDNERDLILTNLMASRLTVLYGASGVGKSSVLYAGVSRTLVNQAAAARASGENPELLVVTFSSWRDDPVTALTSRLESTLAPYLPRGEAVSAGEHLDETLANWCNALGAELLIILDQFEEYFLYQGANTGQGSFFLEFPRAVNRPDLQVNFLIALREDALAKLDAFKASVPILFNNYLRIDHLSQEGAREAITRPIQEYNRRLGLGLQVDIEDALVDAVLSQICTSPVPTTVHGQGAVPGVHTDGRIETPYLQLVMTRLWDEEIAAGSSRLRLETLGRLGGCEEIVSTHLDRAMASLTPGEQAAAARMFLYLVTPSGAKIAHRVGDLASFAGIGESDAAGALEHLSWGDLRILRPVAPPPDEPQLPRYEIFHDVLAVPVLNWRLRYVARETAREEAERAKREAARRWRILLGGGAAAAILAGVVGFQYASSSVQDANNQADRYQTEAEQTEARADSQGTASALSRQGLLALAAPPTGATPTPTPASQVIPTPVPAPPQGQGQEFFAAAFTADQAGENDRAIELYLKALGEPDLPETSRQTAQLEIGLLELLATEEGVWFERCEVGKDQLAALLASPNVPGQTRSTAQQALDELQRRCARCVPSGAVWVGQNVTLRADASIREDAGVTKRRLDLGKNRPASVIDGAKCADGLVWWQVRTDSLTGWVAERDQNQVQLIVPQ
jgi:hypothetical protein